MCNSQFISCFIQCYLFGSLLRHSLIEDCDNLLVLNSQTISLRSKQNIPTKINFTKKVKKIKDLN